VIDFGTVAVGVYQRMPVTITNAAGGAAFGSVYASQQQPGPFLLLNTPAGSTALQPGESRQLLAAVLSTQAPGTFEATYLVSAFQPGVLIDPSCGVIRSITMRAQVSNSLPPP
jgi:hypothetical protein